MLEHFLILQVFGGIPFSDVHGLLECHTETMLTFWEFSFDGNISFSSQTKWLAFPVVAFSERNSVVLQLLYL